MIELTKTIYFKNKMESEEWVAALYVRYLVN